ncbi:MAG: CDP-glycerol glycerophosphotransferase family protein [Xanthomonadales bacterium]|jgi:YidC/Oxa1 family membrane protein insertase|nr:CDP-glycerol glycerophosphotransferase family protein [Xanthomonadales bacterium]
MKFFAAWKGWRRFKQLPPDWRNIVIYSESGQDWHQFSGLVEELNGPLGRKTCYVTSDADDPGLKREHGNFQALCIPEGLFLTIFFQVNQSDLFVLTMMDLENLQLKRSLHPVHYLYLFHSMGSTHLVDHEDSFDHYDTLFCAGPHQVAEIRRREELKGLPQKQLFDYGHPRLEEVIAAGKARQTEKPLDEPPVLLIAPTWGETSLFNTCGEELISVLLDAGFQVIMRPHYQSNRQTPEVIASLRGAFEGRSGFEYIDRQGETESIIRSDLLVCDWSGMALEYGMGLEKPVLFIDVPRRIRNPNWKELGIEPIENRMREQLGEVVSPDALQETPAVVERLLADPERFRGAMQKLRETLVFRLGHSVPDGAAEIARLAKQQHGIGSAGKNG